MKITNINIKNYAGVRSFDAVLAKPVTLIAGHNGAGKSSIAEAIRHALTGEATRVGIKKLFAEMLLHEGTDAGHAIITTDDGDHAVILPDGEVTGDKYGMLALLTDPKLFASYAPTERRAFLFDLLGLDLSAASIAAKLSEKNLSVEHIGALTPHLSGGFDSACNEAKSRARDEKTAWRTITGETYGEKKAETWVAPKTQIDDKQVEALTEELTSLEAEITTLSEKYGASAGINKQHADLSAELETLREKAGKFSRIQDKLHRDEAELKQWQEKVEETRKKANGQIHTPLACPHCAGLVVLGGDGTKDTLTPYTDEAKADPEAQARLTEYLQALALMENSVANGKRDLDFANNAANQLAGVEDKLSVLKPVDVEELSQSIKDKKAMLKLKRDTLDNLKTIVARNADADAKTKSALARHHSVLAWDAIAQALSPDGIQADMLNDALERFNEALKAAPGTWDDVWVDQDMAIHMGIFLYDQRSESEQWRADAIIATAIAKLSGINFVMLDRFDVLDLKGRGEAMKFFGASGIQSIIIGTLKEPPAKLPTYIQAHWIENGQEAVLEVAA